MRSITRLLSAAALTGFLLIPLDARACPNCKEAVASQSSEQQGLTQGYSYSVLFMIAMPFALLTTGVVTVVRASRKGFLPPM